VFMIDTHIHTCLSPCADLDMHPAALVDAAIRAGLDSVAVCDHNSAENAAAVQRAGASVGLSVIPGMEITSAEEVHILGLLPDLEAALTLQSKVYRSLPGHNDEKTFGMQVIANEYAEVLGFDDHFLAGATLLTLDQVVAAIHDVDGLAVASHVDREGFGIIGQLGFIPPELPLDAIEVSRRISLPFARASFAPKTEFPILCASDAHTPQDIACAATYIFAEEATLPELRRALTEKSGRTILGGGRPMEDIALHILDIAQNSLEAGAGIIEIEIRENLQNDQLIIEVRDNGCGMDPETLAKAADPFFTTRSTRKVGFGLSLLAAAAKAAGGTFSITSKPGQGTSVTATFQHRHVDRAPLGDIETTLMVLLAGQPDKDIHFLHRVDDQVFELDSQDFRAADIDLTSPMGLATLREAIRKGESELRSKL
jgi:anti-sigma regulatory factor (Ser/Thr protein kinase)/histidinol phosphatase-like PHP family hydrolase